MMLPEINLFYIVIWAGWFWMVYSIAAFFTKKLEYKHPNFRALLITLICFVSPLILGRIL